MILVYRRDMDGRLSGAASSARKLQPIAGSSSLPSPISRVMSGALSLPCLRVSSIERTQLARLLICSVSAALRFRQRSNEVTSNALSSAKTAREERVRA